jgi:hypothetical protein
MAAYASKRIRKHKKGDKSEYEPSKGEENVALLPLLFAVDEVVAEVLLRIRLLRG